MAVIVLLVSISAKGADDFDKAKEDALKKVSN